MVYTFNNGLKLVHRQMKEFRSVAVCVMTGVGSANETASENGISHFIEHMLFKGTTKRTSFDITRDIDDIGAQINAYTTKQSTCYYTVSVDEYAEQCVEILSDLYFNSTFPAEEIEREKGVVLEEISMSEDAPDGLCMDNMSNVYFKGSPLGMNIIGTRENVQSFTRDQIIEFKNSHYCSSNTVVAIVGNIDFDKARDLAEKYFAENFCCCGEYDWRDKPFVTTSDSIITIKPVEQANVGLVFPSIARYDELDYALSVMNSVFGNGMSSRLFQTIREKLGLAYSVFSYPSAYVNNGNFGIYLGTSVSEVERAVKAIRKEILLLMDKGLDDEEIERGKRLLKGAYVLGQESTASLMRIYARHALFTGEMYDFDDFIDKVQLVTREDIDRIVSLIFDFEKVSVAYVGKESNTDILNVIKNG